MSVVTESIRFLRRLAPALTALVAFAGGRPYGGHYDSGNLWKDETVLAVLGEAEAALDAEMGRLPKRPRILLSNREFAFERALSDERKLIKKLFPDADEHFMRAQAAVVAISAFAFYEPETNTIHIIPDNFQAYAEERTESDFLGRDFLRMVLVHELVHAWDDQLHGLSKVRGSLKRPEDIKLWSGVGEGHAQFITRKAMKRMGHEDHFLSFSESVFNYSGSEDDDPLDRLMKQRAAATGRFGYVIGMEFFEALEKSGVPKITLEPFKRLPTSASVILHPERYSAPPQGWPAARDFSPSLRKAVSALQPSWKTMPIPHDEHTLRATAEPLPDKERFDAMLAEFVAGSAIAAMPPPPKAGAKIPANAHASMVCHASEMTGDEQAKSLMGMMLAADKAEEDALEAHLGKVRLLPGMTLPTASSKDDELPAPAGVTAHRCVRTLTDGRLSRSETTVLLRRDNGVAGCVLFDSPHDDKAIARLVSVLADVLAVPALPAPPKKAPKAK